MVSSRGSSHLEQMGMNLMADLEVPLEEIQAVTIGMGAQVDEDDIYIDDLYEDELFVVNDGIRTFVAFGREQEVSEAVNDIMDPNFGTFGCLCVFSSQTLASSLPL